MRLYGLSRVSDLGFLAMVAEILYKHKSFRLRWLKLEATHPGYFGMLEASQEGQAGVQGLRISGEGFATICESSSHDSCQTLRRSHRSRCLELGVGCSRVSGHRL